MFLQGGDFKSTSVEKMKLKETFDYIESYKKAISKKSFKELIDLLKDKYREIVLIELKLCEFYIENGNKNKRIRNK